MESLGVDRYRNIVVLTGAGISAASGLPTYRGPGGLWETVGEENVPTARSLIENPQGTWALVRELRERSRSAAPNPAHTALARLEERTLARGASFTLVTQNVDGLHRRAGSSNVIEFHGSLFRARCSRDACESEPIPDDAEEPTSAQCSTCGSALRPDVVLFDELIPARPEWDVKRALRACDLFIAVGTSGTVSPASSFVRSAAYAGARTILVNLEPMQPRHPDFHEEYLGRAETLLPLILD